MARQQDAQIGPLVVSVSVSVTPVRQQARAILSSHLCRPQTFAILFGPLSAELQSGLRVTPSRGFKSRRLRHLTSAFTHSAITLG